jgi:hypothetical protein
MAGETYTPWNRRGLFELEKFPKLVRVAVEVQDYELTSATWPDPDRGIGSGEGAGGEVQIELRVPAGTGRRVRGLGFVTDGARVQTYQEQAPLSLDLVAGKPADLTLPLVPHEAGAAEVTVRCETGNQGPWLPIQIAPVDAKALVLYPPRNLTADANQALQVLLEGMPVGRPHQTRIVLRNRTSGKLGELYLLKPTFTVMQSKEKLAATLVVPCDSAASL